MGFLKKSLLGFILLLLALIPLRGMSQTLELDSDTLEIRFKLDSVQVNMHFDGNLERWDQFERDFNRRFAGRNRLGIVVDIYSGASPEGTVEHNRWLGQERGESIKRLIEQRLRGRVGYIMVHNEAARWEGLYREIESSDEPWKEEVLRIIGEPASVNENGRDRREYKLRNHKNPDVWNKMLSTYLPPLRSGGTAVVSWMPELIAMPAAKDTVYVMYDNPPCATCPPTPIVVSDELGDLYVSGDTVTLAKPVVRKPVWILSTNLPLLATGTPNLKGEWSLDHKDRWSVNIEGVWSWWTFAHNVYANEIIYGSVELRYWLGRRWRHHTLDGWHIGLGIGGGYGDLEWTNRGFQGEVYSGFVNIGWQKRFGRNRQWAFDAGVGLGYAHVDWRRYRGSQIFPTGREEALTDHLMWRETGHTNWLGTPHFNISIGYVFPVRDAGWRRAKAVSHDIDRNAALQLRDSIKALDRFERDSVNTAEKYMKKQVRLLPTRAERKAALKQFESERQQARADAKAARKQVVADRRVQRKQDRLAGKQDRQRMRDEKEARKIELKAQKEWLDTPEGREAVRKELAEEKIARKQQRLDAKAARKKARLERKLEKVNARKEYELQRHEERLKRDIDNAERKYLIR